jgi:hypothetical protein
VRYVARPHGVDDDRCRARDDQDMVPRTATRLCYFVGAALILVGLMHLVPAVVYSRPWFGPLSWRKAVTFGVSFGVTLIAVAGVASRLRLSPRTRSWLLGIFAVDCVVEVVGVSVQAWRHVPSHLNTETRLDATIAAALAAGGAVLVVTLGSFAVVALRGGIDASPSMQLALKAGFGLLLAGLASGIAMIVRGARFRAAGDIARAYVDLGYLKWFHGVTLHAILVLPLVAWLLGRTDWDEPRRIRRIAWLSGAYVAVALLTLMRSLAAV